MTTSIDAGRVWQTQHGYRDAPQHEILRTVVGSGVHGIAIEGTDDHDEMGVYIEPPEMIFRPGPGFGGSNYIARTVPEGERSVPGSVDLTMYSLRKYLGLVLAGNPTVLVPLFAPPSDVLLCNYQGGELRERAPSLICRQSADRFLGYLSEQRRRITSGSKMPNRPELVSAYGYDVKYAAHALRIGIQAIELLGTGRITLPMPEPDRTIVRNVKRGRYPLDAVLGMIDRQAAKVHKVREMTISPLAERPDTAAAAELCAELHLSAWGLT